jgi:hypothetical protein
MCDYVIFYRLLPHKKPVIVFAELKASDFSHAVDQVKSTFTLVKQHIPRDLPKPRYHALILLSNSAPASQAKLQKELQNQGITMKIRSGVKARVELRQNLTP